MPDLPSVLQIDNMARSIHAWVFQQGFYAHETLEIKDDDWDRLTPRRIANPSFAQEKLLLIVSEVVEVLEARRDGNSAHEAEEIADIVIRCFDYAAWRGFSIGEEIRKKMKENEQRPYLHGRQF